MSVQIYLENVSQVTLGEWKPTWGTTPEKTRYTRGLSFTMDGKYESITLYASDEEAELITAALATGHNSTQPTLMINEQGGV